VVRRTFVIATSPFLLMAAIVLAHAQDVPSLDIEPVCRGIAKQATTAGERGGPDLGLSQCIKSEQATRERLAKEWSTFAAADKASCVGEEKLGPLPSYTDLATCLEMARDARKMNTSK
jgi:hypothetical protein